MDASFSRRPYGFLGKQGVGVGGYANGSGSFLYLFLFQKL